MDSFLNYDYFLTLFNEVNKNIDKVNQSKQKLKEISKKFQYQNIFNTQGAQGITGLLKFKEINQKIDENIVFKLSADIDRAIEHEFIITNELNNLRKFCPHFMTCFSMINLPISNSFIDENRDSDSDSDSDDYSSSDDDKDTRTRSDSDSDNDENDSESDVLNELELRPYGKNILVKCLKMEKKKFWEMNLNEFCPQWRNNLKAWLVDGKYREDLLDVLGMEDREINNNPKSSTKNNKVEKKDKEIKVDKPEKKVNLFDSDKDNLPTNVLLLEYVSNLSFYHICKYSDKRTILSQFFMMLIALQIAQNKNNFTHYDLHMDNILTREVENDSYFCYRFQTKKGEKFESIPTFGFFPVIIDMGSSYLKQLEGKPLYTDITNYSYGLQPTVFDPIDDIHHFLLSAFDYLQPKSDEFYFLNHRIMNLLKHIKVYRKKGWKKLPTDIMRVLVRYLIDLYPEIGDSKLFDVYDTELLEILSYSIILPFNNNEINIFDESHRKELKDNLISLLEQLELFSKLDLFNDFDLLFILREIIDIVNSYRNEVVNEMFNPLTKEELKKKVSVFKKIDNEVKNKVCFLLTEKFPKVNFEIISKNLIIISKYFSAILFEGLKDNLKVIEDSYEKTTIKEPYDIFKILKQNSSVRNKFHSKTKIYLMDSIKEEKKEILLDEIFTEEEIKELNKNNYFEQNKILEKKIIH